MIAYFSFLLPSAVAPTNVFLGPGRYTYFRDPFLSACVDSSAACNSHTHSDFDDSFLTASSGSTAISDISGFISFYGDPPSSVF